MDPKTSPFRLEFLLPGVATLLAVAWLAGALAYPFGADPWFSLLNASDVRLSTPVMVGIAVLAAATTYIVGVLTVMFTFRRIAEPIQHEVQRARLNQLKRYSAKPLCEVLDEVLFGPDRDKVDPTEQPTAATSEPDVERPHIGFALSVARQHANAGVIGEYEYRRYLRQLTSGIIPGEVGCVIAAMVTDWHHFHVPLWANVALRLGALVAGIVTVRATIGTVRYQERVAQGLLIDVAVLLACPPSNGATATATGAKAGSATPRSSRTPAKSIPLP